MRALTGGVPGFRLLLGLSLAANLLTHAYARNCAVGLLQQRVGIAVVAPETIRQIEALGLKPEKIVDFRSLADSQTPPKMPEFDGSRGDRPSRLKVDQILFMQNACSSVSGDGQYTVLKNALDLRDGSLSPSAFPTIRVWRDKQGKIWSLDHRRLTSLVLAGVKEIKVEWAPRATVLEREYKFSTTTDGKDIVLNLGGGNAFVVQRNRNFALEYRIKPPGEALDYVESLWERPIPAKVRVDLERKWDRIDQDLEDIDYPSALPLSGNDPRQSALQSALEYIRVNREEQSRTVRGRAVRNESVKAAENFETADEQIQEWIDDGKPITQTRVRELNAILTNELYNNGKVGGHFRTGEISAGKKARYLPRDDLNEAFNDFFQWLRKSEAEDEMHPIELAAKAYTRFVSIHPFQDGNGRTSRLLMDWILESHGYPPATFTSDSARNLAIFPNLSIKNNRAAGRAENDMTDGVLNTVAKMRAAMNLNKNHLRELADGTYQVIVPLGKGHFDVVPVETKTSAMKMLAKIRAPADIESEIYQANESLPVVMKALNPYQRLPEVVDVYGRAKSVDSFREKLFRWGSRRDSIRFSNINDVVGTRIVVKKPADIARIIKQLRSSQDFSVTNENFVRLSNGYQAEHVTATLPNGQIFEIQIRTLRMERWANWSHDRVYKPSAHTHLDDNLRSYSKAIIEYLESLDEGLKVKKPDLDSFQIPPEDRFPDDQLVYFNAIRSKPFLKLLALPS